MTTELAPSELLVQTPELPSPTALSRLLTAFRAALAERGVEAPRVFRAGNQTAATCTRCFLEGAEGLGYSVDVAGGGAGTPFQAYRSLTWNIEGATQADPGRVELYAPTTFGLIRLQRDEESPIWLGSCEVDVGTDRWHQVLIAAADQEAVVELLQASHERHAGRRRKDQLLLFDGRNSRWVEAGEHAWEDLILPEGLREELQEAIGEFFAARELYAEHGLPHRRGVLLAGEPGNGKTSIIKVLAAQLELPVVLANLSDAHPAAIRSAFEQAQQLAPAVLCFEDLDALIDDNGQRLSMFLNVLDGVVPLDGVLVLATTNRPDRIDPAIARRPSRFDRVFLIPQPERPQRQAFLARLLGDAAPEGSSARLAEATDGYSMAFLEELVLQARLHAVRRGSRRLTAADLDLALENTREHLRLASQGLEQRDRSGSKLRSPRSGNRRQRPGSSCNVVPRRPLTAAASLASSDPDDAGQSAREARNPAGIDQLSLQRSRPRDVPHLPLLHEAGHRHRRPRLDHGPHAEDRERAPRSELSRSLLPDLGQGAPS